MKNKLLLITASILIIAAMAFYFLRPGSIQLSLVSKEIEDIPAGTGVIFGANFRIGEIIGSELFPDHVEYIVAIQKKHQEVINRSSKFYVQKKRVNGEIIRFIKVETPEKNAGKLEDGTRIDIQPKSFWDIFK